ncbi:MAG: translocation/assembly module TamB domain-containing protein [Polyangiaceae bacterium]|nr:translocation/assembly module TamB domain-containing protein [Polyangiaceae bacterium]
MRPPPAPADHPVTRWIARGLLVALAALGALPLVLALALRSPAVQARLQREAQAALLRELGLSVTLRAEVRLLPPEIVLRDVVVPATDGPAPALTAPRVRVRPKLFTLLSGRLDAGDVTIEAPRVRLLVDATGVKNVKYHLPPARPRPPGASPPVTRLSLEGADVDVSLPGLRVEAVSLFAQASLRDGPTADVAVELERGRVTRARGLAVDEDVICGLGLDATLAHDLVLVRRLELSVGLDRDAAPGTAPSCDALDDGARASLALSEVALAMGATPAPSGHARVKLDAPLSVVDRVTPASAPRISGRAAVDLELDHDGSATLPRGRGSLRVDELAFTDGGTRHLAAHTVDAVVTCGGTSAELERADVRWGGGEATLTHARVALLEPGLPVDVERVAARGLQFPAIMAELGVTDHTIVKWSLDSVEIKDFRGKIVDPERDGPLLQGDITGVTSDFEVGDHGWDHPARRRLVGVRRSSIRGKFGVEPDGLTFNEMLADFGHSHLDVPRVFIGFQRPVEVRAVAPSRVDLADIGPLAEVEVAGRVDASLWVHEVAGKTRIDGDLKATSLALGGLPLADTMTARAAFVPLVLELTEVRAQKGRSPYEASLVRLDFDRPRGVVLDARVTTKELDLRDALAILTLETDPRFTEISGVAGGRGELHFEVGTERDRCGGGLLEARAMVDLGAMQLYGERYDGGAADVEYIWFDRAGEHRGVDATLRSFTVKKGRGVITGSGTLRGGGALDGRFSAHDVPLSRVDALGDLGRAVDGSVNASGTVSGTLDDLASFATVSMPPVRIGQRWLPASDFTVELVPARRDAPRERATRCGSAVPRPFDRAEYDRDVPAGVFHTSGELFGGSVVLRDVATTRQRSKRTTGEIALRSLDLGALAQLSPSMALSDAPPSGALSATVRLRDVENDRPELADATVELSELSIQQRGVTARLARRERPVAVELSRGRLAVSELAIEVATPGGASGTLALRGDVKNLGTTRDLDLSAELLPIDLSALSRLLPAVESSRGKVDGKLVVRGRAGAPELSGEVRLRGGELTLTGMPVALEGVDLVARVSATEIQIVHAEGRAGGGKITLSGKGALRGYELGDVELRLDAEGVRAPVVDGVDMTVDARVALSSRDPGPGKPRRGEVRGDLTIASFLYTRPIGFSVNLDQLAKQGRRTEVTAYDPARDLLTFDLAIRASAPLVFRNNLLEAKVTVGETLRLEGTNQRFGLRGNLRVEKGGTLRLRANEFEIAQGTIRFDDPTRVAARVDLRATTDYRRYTSSASQATGASAGAAHAGGGRAGGAWRIALHAHGDADDLKLDLTSEPSLAQDDIVLLLAIGMTRAEIDQLQASNVGSAAAFEALSALSGADNAVKTAIPIIDDFRFGSAYSTRTGRTEPTVTVGKRLTPRLRANVVTGLTENRDVRSNLEWRLSPTTSVLGNYDNLNDVTSQGLGNLGAAFRVRLEF